MEKQKEKIQLTDRPQGIRERMRRLFGRGHEEVSDKPVALSIDIQRPPALAELVAKYVRNEVSRRAEAEGYESFEDADDFEVGDDYEPSSPYEADPYIASVQAIDKGVVRAPQGKSLNKLREESNSRKKKGNFEEEKPNKKHYLGGEQSESKKKNVSTNEDSSEDE